MKNMSRASMKARSSSSIVPRTVFSSRRSAMRRVSKRFCSLRLPPWYRFSMPSMVARDLVEVKERSAQEEQRREHEVAEEDRHALGLVARAAQQEDQHRARQEVDDHERGQRPDGVDVVGPRELNGPTEPGPQAQALGEDHRDDEPDERQPSDRGEHEEEQERRHGKERGPAGQESPSPGAEICSLTERKEAR